MIHGFDLNSPLVCEGIIGDGCGGGRIFFIKNNILFAHDPHTKEDMKLLENIHMPKEVSKKGCVVSIKCETELIEFDLSKIKV